MKAAVWTCLTSDNVNLVLESFFKGECDLDMELMT